MKTSLLNIIAVAFLFGLHGCSHTVYYRHAAISSHLISLDEWIRRKNLQWFKQSGLVNRKERWDKLQILTETAVCDNAHTVV